MTTASAAPFSERDTWRALIGAHDLLYRHPPVEGWQGWLLGNGSAGATLWNPADRLMAQFGHTDLLDGGAESAARAERCEPCLRHAGQLFLQTPDTPLFDALYVTRYEGRLSLAEGVLEVAGESAFGRFQFRAFYAETPAVWVLEYSDRTTVPIERRLRLQRFGTRTLPWQFGAAPDAGIGLAGVAATRLDETTLLIEQRQGDFQVALAAHVRTAQPVTRETTDAHGIAWTFAPADAFTVRLTVAIGQDAPSPRASALAAVRQAVATADDALLADHRRRRAALWEMTFVHLPEDPYFAQLWWLARHYLQATWRGRLPPFFINGPWGWNRDVRMWAESWLHWNLYGASLSLAQLGEADLLRPLIAWRARQLPSARAGAQAHFNAPGAVFQDGQRPEGDTDRWTDDDHVLNVSVGLQLCLQLYDAWRLTGDAALLAETLYPLMRETALFWRFYLQADEASALHVPRSVPYEFHGGYAFRDGLTDHAHLRAFLPAFVRAARALGRTDDLSAWAGEAVGRLAAFQPVRLPLAHVTEARADGRRVYNNPFFHGDPAEDDDAVLAVGLSEKTGAWVSHVDTHFDGGKGYGVFCSGQTAHIFPAGLVTSDAAPAWADRLGATADQRRLYAWSRNALRTLRRFPQTEAQADKAAIMEPTLAWTGHSLELPAFARLGLTTELRRAMLYYVDRYQWFPQGMWNYWPRRRWVLQTARFTNAAGDVCRPEFSPDRLHFSFEPQGIFSATVCLMLLDAAGDLIRLFPAYEKDAVFRLPAPGGFMVTAQQVGGTLTVVEIESARSEPCALRLPWERAVWREDGGAARVEPVRQGRLTFATRAGGRYRLHAEGASGVWALCTPPSAAPRESGSATLGLFRRC